ncbi:MAG: hypothetical protein ABL985_18545 [Casimicrobium sp.]
MRWLKILLAMLCVAGVVQWWQTGGLLWLGAALVALVVFVLIGRRPRPS